MYKFCEGLRQRLGVGRARKSSSPHEQNQTARTKGNSGDQSEEPWRPRLTLYTLKLQTVLHVGNRFHLDFSLALFPNQDWKWDLGSQKYQTALDSWLKTFAVTHD